MHMYYVSPEELEQLRVGQIRTTCSKRPHNKTGGAALRAAPTAFLFLFFFLSRFAACCPHSSNSSLDKLFRLNIVVTGHHATIRPSVFRNASALPTWADPVVCHLPPGGKKMSHPRPHARPPHPKFNVGAWWSIPVRLMSNIEMSGGGDLRCDIFFPPG